jgi:hypothetical protein
MGHSEPYLLEYVGGIMDNTGVPFVAVIGGLWQLDKATAEDATAAGGVIGAELAKAGFGLLVYFSNNESLEPHVVSGYSAALTNSAGRIRVRYAESQRGQIKFKEEVTRPELFRYHLFPGQDWEAPFYRSLAEEDGVDAVLLLGGATSTLIAGQIAVARGLPILAVDKFGGSAAKIWSQLAQASPGKPRHSWAVNSPADIIAQLKSECAQTAERRREVRRHEQLFTAIVAQRRKVTYAAGALVVLLLALLWGMVCTLVPSAYPGILLLGLAAAGATGALARLVFSGPAETDPRTSLFLGSLAGVVVGLAYLVPQWVGAHGILETTVSISATEKIQFASAILVAISAGVGFDTVFNRLQKQAQDVAIGPPRIG